MLFTDDRDRMRRFYCEAWRKQGAGGPMEPLERRIAGIIAEHPEYHALMADPEAAVAQDYPPEAGVTNPFLHLAMHVAVQEQLASDRPAGILKIYQRLCRSLGDAHAAEHRMMASLAEMLWEAQHRGTAPDEGRYLARLRRLTRRH